MIVGIGIDLLEISRMERALGRTGGRFLDRVFTVDERAACEASGGGAERWAARFAAKEAVLKALGTGWSGGIGRRLVVTRPTTPQRSQHGGGAHQNCRLLQH